MQCKQAGRKLLGDAPAETEQAQPRQEERLSQEPPLIVMRAAAPQLPSTKLESKQEPKIALHKQRKQKKKSKTALHKKGEQARMQNLMRPVPAVQASLLPCGRSD